MATIKQIQFKRTTNPGVKPTPTQLAEGELAINLPDRTLFTKDNNGLIVDLGFAKGGTIDGNVTQTGDFNLTGNFNQTGDMNVEGNTTLSKALIKNGDFKEIIVSPVSPANGENLEIKNTGGMAKKLKIIASGTETNSSLILRHQTTADTYTDVINFSVTPAGVPDTTVKGNIRIDARISANQGSFSVQNISSTLGGNSISLGEANSGFRWNSAGRVDTIASGISLSKTINGITEFTRRAYFRYASDADGNTYTRAPINDSLITIETSLDGNGNNSFIGGTDADGNFSHYFRGNGATYIDTKNGLVVAKDLFVDGRARINAADNFISNNVAANQLGYIGGNVGGKINAWQIGKTGGTGHITFSSNPTASTDQHASVILDPAGSIAFQTATNIIQRIGKNNIYLNGLPWSAQRSHAWSDQWNTDPAFFTDFGYGPGTSDFYAGYGIKHTIANSGFGTRFTMGMLRSGIGWGTGVLAVHSAEGYSGSHPMATYQFNTSGHMSSRGILVGDLGLAISNGGNALGTGSIALGDPDTGIKWHRDGVYSLFSNGKNMFTIEVDHVRTEMGVSLASHGDLNQANDGYSTYVRDIYVRSDIRVKSQLRKFESPSETSKKLNGYLYLQKKGLNEDGSINWVQSSGLIAQEVQAVLPELISVDKDNPEGLLRLNYNGIIALNTSTINEHTDEISELKSRIQKLEELISTLI